MRLISHEKLCSTLQIALGIKERQKEIANFRKRYGKDKRTWDALKGASGSVGLPLFSSLQPFSGWNLLDGHTCQSCDKRYNELTIQTMSVPCFDKYNMVS